MNTAIKAQLTDYSKRLAEGNPSGHSFAFEAGVMRSMLADIADSIPEARAYLEWLGALEKEDEAA